MNHPIRRFEGSDEIVKSFTYDALFIPPGENPPSFDVLDIPELRCFYESFGTKKDDIAFASYDKGVETGMAWAREISSYGYYASGIPVLSIAVRRPYRGRGIGTALLFRLADELIDMGYVALSLSVDSRNPAVHLYERFSARIVGRNGDELTMLIDLLSGSWKEMLFADIICTER